ncbi:hypothetical protein BR93DRAFT_958766 [Coniochaeta sp. PMI_546]|nr:hypothetical protein BR93DRAFT_958766 [Coniochaeta sp. PMI_546]
MPKQYVVFGRPVPHGVARRAPLLLAGLAIFAVVSLLFTVPTQSVSRFHIPKSFKSKWSKLDPFHPPAHDPPPKQANDTYNGMSWYSDWKWLNNPFSSTVTLDENRSLLPVLKRRPPIYCYYDHTVEKDEETKDAESDLLLTWRRAWWAQGFKPVILGPEEATHNPMYDELQTKTDFDPALKTAIMQWLAWENMGAGLLSHYLTVPMGAHDAPLLTWLREGDRGEYPKLTRWDGLDAGLFAGPKTGVAEAIKLAMATTNGNKTKDFLSAIPADQVKELFTLDTQKSVAFYDAKTVQAKYPKVADVISKSGAAGLRQLNQLINAHLHATWMSQFPDGIAVLKPLPEHTTHLIAPAYELAQRLSHCPETPLPASCPPNNGKCSPCVSAHPMKISTPFRYRNQTTLFTLGTVPHPYTTALLSQIPHSDRVSIPWLVRSSPRDPWLTAATKEIYTTGVSASTRVLRLKEAIGSESWSARSLWFSAEREPPIPDDVDWRFGFAVPRQGSWADDGRSETPVPGPERRPPPPPADPKDGPVPKKEELDLEPGVLRKAREVVKSKDKADVRVRDAVEAWNLADTEIWRFTRAFLARSRVERLKWEEEEARFAGGAGSEKGRRGGWGRWLDREKES